MGLSLHNIGKKIGDVLGGVERQINPFDNGATYSNPNPQQQQQQQTAQTPAPGVNMPQNGPVPVHPNMPAPGSFFDNLNPQLAPTPVVTAQNSKPKHSAIPLINSPVNTGPLNPGPLTIGKVALNPAPMVQNGRDSSVTPLDIARSFITQPAAEIATSAISAIPGFQNTSFTPGSKVEKALFGKQQIKPIQQDVAGVYHAVKSGHQNAPGGVPVSPSLAVPYAAADAALHAAQDIPFVGAGVKLVSKGAKVALKGADAAKVVDTVKPTVKAAETATKDVAATPEAQVVTPTEKATATTASQGAPAAPIVTPAPVIPKTSMPEVNAAIKDVSTQYATPVKFEGGVQDVVRQAQGQSTIGSRAANGLRKALKDNLSAKERTSVSDILDNHPGAVEAATPKAQEAAQALKPLQDQGFSIRQAINPNINKVQDYVTRIRANTIGAAANGGGKVLGKIRSLSDITNLNSVFSQTRQVGKFVGDDGKAIYGNPSTLGLVRHADGTITNSSGNSFKQVAVSKRELEANGAGKYEHNIARISGIYHADTASLKVRAEALQHLKANPEAVGLHPVETAPAGSIPVTKVPELSGMYGAPKDVKALEDNFGYRQPTSLPGKVYDAVSNVATQFIVLNPAFHGMNQLYQAGIAAGNMPGIGNGWLKLAQNIGKVGEQDIRDYLAAGGHIPDYGMGRENLLSNMTHGATKLNNKAMNAIESKLRVGLYKASIEKGMNPADAVKNIDKFLGDSHAVGTATRRFTLFFHYFRTMTGALGSQVAHPIENMGANVNTAALAAITAAVTYGYQEFTGNPKAYVRVPGELGLVKEGVGSVEGLMKGDPAKATQVVTNRINPVLKEGAQQLFNKDLFTGKSVRDTPGQAASHAVSSLIAPAQVASRVGAGSKSKAEVGLNQLGLYTPHAKGYQASPNLPINTKDAIPGNGVKEQDAYFKGLDAAKKAVAGDTASTDALTKYLGRSHDPNTGQSIQNSPSESQQNSEALATNDKLRNTVQNFEKSQPSHDPMWDLPADQLKAFMQYKAQFTGDSAKNVMFVNANSPDGSSNWIKDIEAKQNDYYNNIKYPGGSKIPEKNPQTPDYPKFDAFTQQLLDTYDNGSPQDKSALLQNYGPQLSDAWQQKSDWTNAMRRAEGTLELKGYPQADDETKAILKTYNALPQHDGSKGGNATRYAWGQAHPAEYAKMQDYLSQAAMSSLVRNASLDQFKGTEADQALLKDIKNVGTYDIVTTTNADGTKSYALNPSAAASAYASSYASSNNYSKGAGKGNPTSRQAYRDNKKMSYYAKIPKTGAKIKRPSVKLSKSSTSVKFKGTPKLAKSSKVALKPSKV